MSHISIFDFPARPPRITAPHREAPPSGRAHRACKRRCNHIIYFPARQLKIAKISCFSKVSARRAAGCPRIAHSPAFYTDRILAGITSHMCPLPCIAAPGEPDPLSPPSASDSAHFHAVFTVFSPFSILSRKSFLFLEINIKESITFHYVELYTLSTGFSTPMFSFIFNVFSSYWKKLTAAQPPIALPAPIPQFVYITTHSAYMHHFPDFPVPLRFHNADLTLFCTETCKKPGRFPWESVPVRRQISRLA